MLLKLHDSDTVSIATKNDDRHQKGFKYTSQSVSAGEPVIKYGNLIGHFTSNLDAGVLVESEHIAPPKTKSNCFNRLDSGYDEPACVGLFYNPYQHKYATKKTILVVAMVSCVNATVRQIAAECEQLELRDVAVIPIFHDSGCGLVTGGADHTTLQRCIDGYIRNPNCYGSILVGLGCEDNSVSSYNLPANSVYLAVQDLGEKGVLNVAKKRIKEQVVEAGTYNRTLRPISDLVVGLQCGGSDGFSAITANPLLGYFTTFLLKAGGSAILAETPEVRGFEEELVRLAGDNGVKLADIFAGWDQAGDLGTYNPSPGNRDGGIYSNIEKSIGSVLKFGFNEIKHVLKYGERLPDPGMAFMDSPGYDPCSVTGQISSGANLIIFTTGRGSNYRNSFVPTVKVSSNSECAKKMSDTIDYDAEELIFKFGAKEAVRLFIENLDYTIQKRCVDDFVHSDFVIDKKSRFN